MKTGTGNLGLDLLLLLAMILGGTWFVLWFATSPLATQQIVVDGTQSAVAFLLAQPGLILGTWIAMRAKRSLRWRLAGGLSIIAFAGIAFPLLAVKYMGNIVTLS